MASQLNAEVSVKKGFLKLRWLPSIWREIDKEIDDCNTWCAKGYQKKDVEVLQKEVDPGLWGQGKCYLFYNLKHV